MKFVDISLLSLLVTVAEAASLVNTEFVEQVESQLRKKNNRNVPGSPEDWLNTLNAARKENQESLGGTYSALAWSNDLMGEAQTWANDLAIKCANRAPSAGQNPGDYGVATILNMRNPQLAVDRWVTNGQKADRAGTIPSEDSHPYTQMLWSGTKFVGCADATSDKSGKSCSSSVCFYALAGNCAWKKYDTWKDAVLSGRVCSSVCPSDGTC